PSGEDGGREATWQWLTYAQPTVEPGGVRLAHAGRSLRLRVLAPERVAIAVDDVSGSAHPFDSPNPGLRRIVIRVPTPAGATGRLDVVAEPGSVGAGGGTAPR